MEWPQAVELQNSLKELGIKATLAKYTGLEEESAEIATVAALFEQI